MDHQADTVDGRGKVALLEQRYGQKIDEAHNYVWSAAASLVMSHISTRHFLPKPLPLGTLEVMIAAAQSASTGSLLQSWSVIAVTDPERKAHCAKLSGDQEFINEAPLFLLWCADLSRLADASAAHGSPGGGAGLARIDNFIMASLDTAMAAQNAGIVAESLGLGMCYVGGARNNARDLTEYMNLPDRVIGLFGMAVGWADPTRANAAKPRIPVTGVLHRDIWDDEASKEGTVRYESILRAHYERQKKSGRIPFTEHLANFVSSSNLDGRGRMRGVLDDQNFHFL